MSLKTEDFTKSKYLANPAYWFSGAFAVLSGLTLAFQDAGRTNKALSQPLAVVLILLSLFWNQREIYLTEKRGDPNRKFSEMLPKFHRGILFSSVCMILAYGLSRNLTR